MRQGLKVRAAVFVGAALAVLAAPGHAQEPAGVAASACFAKVWRLGGEVVASTPEGSRSLHAGDVVRAGERLRAGKSGEAVLKTADAGIVALRPNTDLMVESYAAEGRAGDHEALRLNSGSLRLVSGWVARLNRPGVSLGTPTASIATLGTDHEPYVMPEDLADATPYEPGTYDKVSRGKVMLKSLAGELLIKAGQIGFAPKPAAEALAPQKPDRGLMSTLLPALLERVPDFYLAGRFDHDIDEYSAHAEQHIDAALARIQSDPQGAAAASCQPGLEPNAAVVAKDWVARFDAAVLARDARAVLALFADDAVIEASINSAGGQAQAQRLDRKQFARSLGAAMQGLQDYSQDRVTLDADLQPDDDGAGRIKVRSHVVERGKLDGRPYAIESDEEYLLAQQQGQWLALRAATAQR